eukprot:TRINITY_DN8036_c2_g1_i1.p1 TRINITY_DN8036_c2_g1~~TRINITY_DN8036_c2_g1_i1.p1  ORF type:complete len:459 (+),score=69.13 TRINITY_DN8036_c2_g1_i1:52-1428(+)
MSGYESCGSNRSFRSVRSNGEVLGTGSSLARKHWVASGTVDTCRICSLEFGILRRKHHCRHCGEVICDSCSQFRFVLESDSGATGKRRVCALCATKCEQDRQHPLFHLLGTELGELYFYRFLRNGDDDIDQLCEIAEDPQLLEVLFGRNKILKKHRSAIADRLYNFSKLTVPGTPAAVPVASPNDRAKSVEVSSITSPAKRTPRKQSIAPAGSGSDDSLPPAAKSKGPRFKSKKGSVSTLMKEKARLEKEIKQQEQTFKSLQKRVSEMQELRCELAVHRAKETWDANYKEDRQKEWSDAQAKHEKEVRHRKSGFEQDIHHKTSCSLCLEPHSGWGGEHHCRGCYQSVCTSCSSGRKGDQRLCDWCMADYVLNSKNWLQKVSSSAQFRNLWLSRFDKMSQTLSTLSGLNPEIPAERIQVAIASAKMSASAIEDDSLPMETGPGSNTHADSMLSVLDKWD